VNIEQPNITHNKSQKGIMQEHTVDQNPDGRLNQRQPWMVCLSLLGVALLLSVALASATLNHLVPKVPDRAPGVTARMDWYLHSGQLQADARTFAATIQYIVASESDTPTVTKCCNLPVADNAAPRSPKS
jgi:hypothetical protein